MSDIKRNINLVCLFKGTDNYLSSLEPGGYVDTMLKEPYSLATAYLKAYADKDISIRHKYNINLLNLKDDGKGLTDSVRFQNEFLGKILYNNPFAIGFSTYCWNIDTTITLIQKIKKIRPKTIIILGGRYALNEYLYKYPEIDFVIRGEGEIPFSDLVKKNFSKNEITPGISYIKDKILLDGGEGHIVKDIDTIPSPYTTGLIKPNIYNMMIELSRGCLNNCGYCEWNSNKTLRIHSEKRIREEILFAIRNRLRHITIIDSAINYNKILLQSLLRICKELDTDSPLFSYNLRYEHINKEQIRYLKYIPSFQVLLGLESTNPKALVFSNREPANLRKFENAVKLLNLYCEPLIGIILGLPGDSPDSFRHTIRYLESVNKQHKIGGVLISLLQIFPNSYLYRHRRYFKIRLQKKGVPYLISSLSWKNTQLRNIYLWLNNYSKTSNLNIKGIEGGWTIEKAKQ